MRLIIAGGREAIITPRQIDDGIDTLPVDFEVTIVVSGGAHGADRCGEIWAEENGIKVERHLPDYNAFGKLAPKVRNRNMAVIADALLAFWDGMSPGTAHMIAAMTAEKKPVRIIMINQDEELK